MWLVYYTRDGDRDRDDVLAAMYGDPLPDEATRHVEVLTARHDQQ